MARFRYTKDVIQKLLDTNEGFSDTTSYSAKNSRETNYYHIEQGKLYCRSKGKGAFGGSQYDKTYICDIDRTRRFLKEREHVLNTSSVMES